MKKKNAELDRLSKRRFPPFRVVFLNNFRDQKSRCGLCGAKNRQKKSMYAQFIEKSIAQSTAVPARLDFRIRIFPPLFFQTLNGGESTLTLDGYAGSRADLAA
jgi:hypothetical protein